MANTSVLYLINPKANDGKALRDWVKIQKKYPNLPKEPENILEINDLTAYVKEKSPELVVGVGGDGTVNRICTALLPLQKKPTVSIFPLGFGNALAHSLGISTLDHAVAAISERKQHVTIDLLKTNIAEYPIGTFNISVGFDARAVYHRMNDRFIGYRSYFLSALRTIFFHNENEMTFTIDHKVQLHATASSLVIANSPVIGLNFLISDLARLNDSYLDCTLFSTKIAFITNLRLSGIRHPFYSNKGKVQFKAKHIRIEGEPFVQIDGDPVVSKTALEVEVLPSRIPFLVYDRGNSIYTSFVKE